MSQQNNFEEQILGNVQFDENGLPIFDNIPHKKKEQTHIYLKPSEKPKQDVVQEEKPQECPTIVSSENNASKLLIQKSKKQKETFDITVEMEVIPKEMFSIIDQSLEETSTEEKIKILFLNSYNESQVKELLWNAFKKYYGQED